MHNLMIPTTANVEVASDLYDAGRTEDGERFTAEVYFVQIDFVGGRRLQHAMRYPGCRVHQADLEYGGTSRFEDIRESARAAAELLADQIGAAGRINMAHWHEVDPAYGSELYIARGIEAERAFMDRYGD